MNYKQMIGFGLILLLILPSLAKAEKEKKLSSKISNVTVFLNGAQVYRKGYFSASAGITHLVFENLTANLDPKSLQASGTGQFLILDVKHNIDYPEPGTTTKGKVSQSILQRMTRLNDSLVEIDFDLADLRDQRGVLEQERKLLLNHPAIQGQEQLPDSVRFEKPIERLDASLQFFRQRYLDINKELSVIKRKEYRINRLKNKVNARLAELNNYKYQVENPSRQAADPIHQVIVTISAKAPVSGSVKINYVVNHAGWMPSYDLRAEAYGKPVALTYKARVYQNTGVDWKGVKLRLSTNNPNQNHRKPDLSTWYVNYNRPDVAFKEQRMLEKQTLNLRDEITDEDDKVASSNEISLDYQYDAYGSGTSTTLTDAGALLQKPAPPPQAQYAVSQVMQTMTNAEFDIPMPYTIDSDNEQHLVVVQHTTLPTEYLHYVVPKLDQDAFLVARVTDWEELNLLPAKANIYYQSTYVGETSLNPQNLDDTLLLDLGRDRSIRVSREKRSDETEEHNLKGVKERIIAYEITVKSNKSTPVKVMIEDQVPVSRTDEIEVDVKETDGARLTESSGKLVWEFQLEGRKTRSMEFIYSIEYDKEKNLLGANL
ncbi:MAG: DUF4139 domain-containing protein [Salibacteraceae bacterium]